MYNSGVNIKVTVSMNYCTFTTTISPHIIKLCHLTDLCVNNIQEIPYETTLPYNTLFLLRVMYNVIPILCRVRETHMLPGAQPEQLTSVTSSHTLTHLYVTHAHTEKVKKHLKTHPRLKIIST